MPPQEGVDDRGCHFLPGCDDLARLLLLQLSMPPRQEACEPCSCYPAILMAWEGFVVVVVGNTQAAGRTLFADVHAAAAPLPGLAVDTYGIIHDPPMLR